MDNKIVNAVFTDSPEEEIRRLIDDIELAKTFDEVKAAKEISPELRKHLTEVILTFAELFSVKVPDIVNNNLDETLETASRDINLSKLLRERGLFRIFRLIKTVDDAGTPIYVGMLNPITGQPFVRMEDLIGYFCEAGHVSRSLVFQRLATIEKCISLGMSLDKAFATIITKPYAIGETLNLIGLRAGEGIDTLSPEVAKKLVSRFLPNGLPSDDFANLGNQELDHDPTREEVQQAVVSLLEEVAAHDRVKEVLDFVRHDVLEKPEITYRWDSDADALIIEIVRKEIIPDGREYISQILSVPFYPDIKGELPAEIRNDLIKRLPIVNKDQFNL